MRVLQILPGLKTDGIAVVVTNYYKFADKAKVQFDFAVENQQPNKYDDYITQNGGRIFRLPNHTAIPLGAMRYCRELAKIIKRERYPVVHVHSNSAMLCFCGGVAAKLAGVGTKVVFSSHSRSCEQKRLHQFFKPLIRNMAAKRFACSEEGGLHMYGKEEFSFLSNAIDFEKYRFNPEKRVEKRKELSIEDSFVVGFSGRISPPKNPLFLLDVYKLFKEKNPTAKLLVCGDGIMMNEVEEKVKTDKIEDVIFAGSVTSTEDYLSAMDVCLFPSFYEGMPMALLEAQASGLPCLCSENIPSIAMFGKNTSTISLEQKELWVETLMQLAKEPLRHGYRGNSADTRFDIRQECAKLLDCYLVLADTV